MMNRKKVIEEIVVGFHAMKTKIHGRIGMFDEKDGITHSQLFVLSIIAEHQNIGIKEVSKKLHISSSAATQLVDSLVENGYVVRKADAKDRRALQLKLSTRGRICITELKNKRMEIVETLFSSLNDEELQMYLQLHKKILSQIHI